LVGAVLRRQKIAREKNERRAADEQPPCLSKSGRNARIGVRDVLGP